MLRRAFVLGERTWAGLMEIRSQCALHSAIVFVQRLDGLFVLPKAGCRQGFHRPNHIFEIPRAVDFSTQTLQCAAHGEALAGAVGLAVDWGAASCLGSGSAGFGLGAGWNEASARVATS